MNALSPRQALADIAKLCDESQAATDRYEADDRERAPWAYPGTVHTALLNVPDVRAILADVHPEPASAGNDVLMPPETLLERVKADGRLWKAGVAAGRQDAPAGGTIDRDALTRLLLDLFEQAMLWGRGHDVYEPDIEAYLDAVLAHVRPVEGVVITREEASACAWALDHLVAKHDYDALRSPDGLRVDLHALAERLEASS